MNNKEDKYSALKGETGQYNLKGCFYLVVFAIVILILNKIFG